MWYLILLLIGAIYSILNFNLLNVDMLESYVIRPLLWISLAIITIFIAYKEGLSILKFKKIWAILAQKQVESGVAAHPRQRYTVGLVLKWRGEIETTLHFSPLGQ